MAQRRFFSWLRLHEKPLVPRQTQTRLTVRPLEDRTVPATIIWDGQADLNFANPINWIGDKLPTLNDDAVIPAAFAGQTITLGTNLSIGSLNSAASLSLTNCGLSFSTGGSNNLVDGHLTLTKANVSPSSVASLKITNGLDATNSSLSGHVDVFGGGTISGTFTHGDVTFRSGVVSLLNTLIQNSTTKTFTIDGATVNIAVGTSVDFWRLNVNSGNLSLSPGAKSNPYILNVYGGTVTISSNAVLSSKQATQYAGTLTGSGDLLITGKFGTGSSYFSWLGGTQSGSGSTVFSAKASANLLPPLSGKAELILDDRQINNSGRLYVGAGTVTMKNNATIANQVDAVVNLHGNVMIGSGPAGSRSRFVNAGVVQSTADSANIAVSFSNSPKGIIDVRAGSLQLLNPLSLSGQILGHGTLIAPINNANGQVRAGRSRDQFTLTGDLKIAGDYTQTATGDFRPELTGKGSLNDRLAVIGNVNLSGTLNPVLSYATRRTIRAGNYEETGGDRR